MWDEEQQKLAQLKVNENSTIILSDERIQEYESNADKYWDKFYGIHENKYIYELTINSTISLNSAYKKKSFTFNVADFSKIDTGYLQNFLS